MALELSTVSSGYDLSTINANFEAIEAAWSEKLDRLSTDDDGNMMSQDLDMDGHYILNAIITDDSYYSALDDIADALANALEDIQDALDQAISDLNDEADGILGNITLLIWQGIA
jgi:hypothetical protein